MGAGLGAIGREGPVAPTAAKLETWTLVFCEAHTGHACTLSRSEYDVSTSNVSAHDWQRYS